VADDKPIIIIKKKGGHGGHHGGAWKVAYADFVTAMMAFFMVMWLVSAAQTPTKQAIASYFRKPGIFESGSGTPLLIGEAGILQDGPAPSHPEDTKQLYPGKSQERLHGHTGTDSDSTGDKRVTYRGEEGKRDSVPDKDAAQRGFQAIEPEDFKIADQLTLNKRPLDKTIENKVGEPDSFGVTREQREQALAVAAQVQQELAATPEFKELLGLVDVKLDADGLNIEIMDTEKTSMFQSGSAQIQRDAEEAFSKLGPIIARFPNTVDIVGHTDARPFGKRPGGYGNWDLSSERANAARKILERNGVPIDRIASEIGRAHV
jgi:chemotaxis protein MotB